MSNVRFVENDTLMINGLLTGWNGIRVQNMVLIDMLIGLVIGTPIIWYAWIQYKKAVGVQ